jgi:hypothetical protein
MKIIDFLDVKLCWWYSAPKLHSAPFYTTVILILLREPQIPHTDNLWRGEPIQRQQHIHIILNHESQAIKLPDLPAEAQGP